MGRLLLLMGLFSACLCHGADDWNPPNLVENPGFEQVSADGAFAPWGDGGSVYTSVADVAHSGARSLRYTNEDADRYVLCGQEVFLEPGAAYEFSAWIKTEGVDGPDSGATICLEWWAEGEKYLGGSYPSGFKGTADWRQLKAISGRVPPTAVSCNITCYLRKGCTGTAWFDDVELRRHREPPLRTLLTRPSYRGLVVPGTGPVQVSADLSLADWGLEPEQVMVRTDVVKVADESLCRTQSRLPAGPSMDLRVNVDGLEKGAYRLDIVLQARAGEQEIGRDNWRLQIVDRADLQGRAAYVDEHNRLICDGEPFFPLGMYFSGVNEEDLRLYADSGFNCLMPYGSPSREQMDLAHSLGLKVIYSVKDIYSGSTYCPKDIETEADERAYIEAKAAEFSGHPALLAWYLNDELPQEYMARLEAHQQWLEELDPGHPTWVVLYQVGHVAAYAKTFDAIGTDPYPIPGSPARRAAEWTQMTVGAVKGSRPVWQVPQVFNWANYRKTEEEKQGLRPPTKAEMRSMAWQCITNGATGLVFYSFFDIKRDTVVPFEEQWGYVKDMAAEIRELSPVILSVEPAPSIRPVSGRGWLHYMVRRLGGKVYLFVVNDGPRAGRATFALGSYPRQVSLRGQGRLTLDDSPYLRCAVEPFGVNVYEIQP